VNARQPVLGDAHTPDTVPGSCYWVTDPDGGLMLIPGCMARVQDPDAECTCATLAARLARVEEQLREEREKAAYAREWYAAVNAALDEHPVGREIRTDAHRRAGR
jgi:hypothetical protein